MVRNIDPDKYDRGEQKKRETLYNCYVLLEYLWGKYKVKPSNKFSGKPAQASSGLSERYANLG